MTLGDLWFIVDVLFWVGFFVLEGFDFGVGMLHSFLGRSDSERRVLLNTIGPVWDGNEVWLIVAGAVIFAAFPGWYATMFSSLYLALVVVLLALMVRGVAFEYQRKFDDPRWRSSWRWGMTIGSALIPLLVGVALGDLLHGLPINSSHEYTGSFWDLLTPFGLWTGVTLMVLSLLMGATYLTLKTTGELHERVERVTVAIGVVAVLVTFGFMTWLHVGLSTGFVPKPIEALALMAVIGAAWAASAKAQGWAFTAAAIGIGATVGSIFQELFPRVMISSTNAAYSLTVNNTASPSYTLKVMTVVAVIFFPIVLIYQAWGYHVFRKRLAVPRVGGD
ncbi:MAG TPA: cytochrome d ubiquinol oxidase subunit II, partial [Acidimicrobiales bacterium]|nr:cytochrome d ubiquinol oxidase subunit II [Acidimicrobiales bacterium]